MFRLRTPSARLAALCLTALALGGAHCAQEREPIDRTRPWSMQKSFFVGADYTGAQDDPEFYMNNYVVDSPADQSLMPVGTYDDVERIRWEVQENLLIARKAYEYVTNSDGRGRAGGRTQTGLIVAAYRIESHFDVRRAYNPTTGEELNIVEENVTDRPWYLRDHIRVDWTRNLVDNPDWAWVWYGSLFGDLSFSPVAYNETNPRSPNTNNFCEMQPGMVRDEASGQCVRAPNPRNHPGGYFDVTSRWLVQPEMSHVFGEPLPTCLIANFFAQGPVYSCNPQETTIRTSFRRVEDRDFEPLELTEQPFDLVGGPRAERNGFDPGYGTNDRNFHRYAMIHNVWMQSHLAPAVGCTSNADENNDGTADACGASGDASRAGSQCDLVMQRCTLPYRRRQVRPIAYYINREMLPEMQDHVTVERADGNDTFRLPTADEVSRGAFVRGASEDIIRSWNMAIMQAVANAREVECRRTGGAREACHDQFFDSGTVAQEDGAFLGPRPKAANGPAVVICHNPVRADDSTACREPGYSARLGDVRYNHITFWPGNSRAPFGGIAHWGYDPLTGEVVSNGGMNMGRSVDFAAAQQRDFILLALGELSVQDYIDGAAAQRFAAQLRNPAAGVRGAMPADEIEARVRGVNGNAAARANGVSTARAASGSAAVSNHDQLLQSALPAGSENAQSAARYEAAATQLRNTALEADMISPSWLAALGFDPNANRTQSLLDQTSPLRRMDPEFAETRHAQLMQRLERRGFCFQDAAPPVVGSQDLQGVARWYLNRYRDLSPEVRARRIFNDLRIEAYKGIALHEIGHSLGLYHVPVSSYDSMNYNPQYWQLRTRNGQANRTCTPVCNANNCASVRASDRNDDNCMGPRYLDPPSDDELGIDPATDGHPAAEYFGNTTTMEYQWERFGETVGIGAYDHYAMGILYGRVLETMELDPARGGTAATEQDRFSARLRTQLSELDQIRYRDPVLEEEGVLPIHYTELARQMNVFDPARCRDATPEERARYKWRVIDGKLCQFGPRDHAAMVDFETTPTAAGSDRVAASWRTRNDARTGGNALRWGYRVAWDIGTGYPHINYFDQGADIYEVTQSSVRKYEQTYPTLYFRRGQREFNEMGIPAYLARAIFRRLRGYHWSVARDTAYYSQALSPILYTRLTRDDNWLRPYLIAGTQIFDFFAGVMLRPEVGLYERMADPVPGHRPLFDVPDGTPTDPAFEIGVIDGRFIGEEFDNATGGSWAYHAYTRRAGSFPEKPLAAIMLTDTRPTFSSVTRSLFLDGREFQVNFRTDMPDAFDRLLGGVLAEDWDAVAMHVPTLPSGGTSGIPAVAPSVLPLWTQPTPTDPTGIPRRPSGAQLVFPNIGYRQQLPTVVYSMLFSSLNSNLDTIHRMRIYTEGGPEAVDIAEADRVRFVNPETGVRYVARRYGPDNVDGVNIDRGIASRMIAHANELLIDTYAVRRDAQERPVVGADGSVEVVLDEATRQPLARYPQDNRRQVLAETRFRNYVGLVDATRYAARLLGYGTLR
ncbi:MAG: hypothetical protein JNK72_11010 [Myxococcales bacterium]|nr:hypothetical protein [Myxococcales bacterium]